MTVSTAAARKKYAGNGTTTAFATTFEFFDDADLTVILIDADGVATTQTLTTNYTVTGGDGSTGTVTMVTAPASGETLVILLDEDLTQSTDFTPGGAFSNEAVEKALDKLTMIDKQQQDAISRSIKIPDDEDPADYTMTLPAAADRAGKVISFDDDGNIDTEALDADTIINAPIAAAASAAAAAVSATNASTSASNAEDSATVASAAAEAATFTVDRFSGDGATTSFTLSYAVNENNAQVYVGGVYQQKNTYSVSGSTLTFDAAPANGTNNIEVVLGATNAMLSGDTSSINYSQGSAGAVTRGLSARLADIVSAADFGAVADGTDQSAEVQLAIDSFGAESGMVLIPAGVVYSYASLTPSPDVMLLDIANARLIMTGVALERGALDTDQVIFRNVSENTATRLYVMPRGTPASGATGIIKIFSTDYTTDQANYADFGFYHDGDDDVFRINSKNNGTVGSKGIQVTFQDGSYTALEFFQGTDSGAAEFAGIVFGGRLQDVTDLAKLAGVPVIFHKSVAFRNDIPLRFYNAAGTSAAAGIRMNSSNDLEILDENGVALLSLTTGGYVQLGGSQVYNSVVATASDTTPSVLNTNFLRYPASGSGTITNLDDGQTGQEVTIVFASSGYTVDHGANIKLAGGVDFTPDANDTITLIKGSSVWVEKCRSVNGT